MFSASSCNSIISKYPGIANYNHQYGTSGFRGHHSTLDVVMVRISLLATIRSLGHNGQAVGIMVTASHNDECDNGVKLVDPSGGMLHQSWEPITTKLMNLNPADAIQFLNEIYNKHVPQQYQNENTVANLFLGRDTRPHSQGFAELLTASANTANCKVNIRDFGEVTTPQLHYCVMKANGGVGIDKINVDMYINDISSAFQSFMSLLSNSKNKTNDESKANNSNSKQKLLGAVTVDCANGVGGLCFQQAFDSLQNLFDMTLIHLPSNKFKVNYKCGAEHVHKKLSVPTGLDGLQSQLTNKKLASVDGDCDRLMYYTYDDKQQLWLMDGDRQTCLIYTLVIKLIRQSGLSFKTGVIQTAYANGAATNYLETVLKVKPVCTSTGVKHLHHEAVNYDISVYFEPNGHGTLLFSPPTIKKLRSIVDGGGGMTSEQLLATKQLLLLSRISNQAIGDAFSDLLMVEASLYALGMTVRDWYTMYQARPSNLTKLTVKDRLVFETTDSERVCLKPDRVQDEIDKLCKKYPDSRAFIRPSGTEDCVRVYAEANCAAHAELLNLEVRRVVYDFAGGVGVRP